MNSKEIGLALQGGGAYAAFTGGVLKALLSSRRGFLPAQDIRSISGTSGGALNAVLLGLALHEGRRNLTYYVDRLWQFNRIEFLIKEQCLTLQLIPDEYIAAFVTLGRRFKAAAPALAEALSGSSRSPKLLAQILERVVRAAAPTLPQDADAPLLPAARPYVVVAATEVRTAAAHYFTNNTRLVTRFERRRIAKQFQVLNTLTFNGLLASLAHPSAFEPVRIGENVYWDGYYTANPPFTYLFGESCREVILIRLVQARRDEVSQDEAFIHDRTEEIVQSATIGKEIQSYLGLREMWLANRELLKGVHMPLPNRKFDDFGVFHEIRLLKPGNIRDQGYPSAALVEKLKRLGERLVSDRKGFVATYRKAPKGRQIISEVDYVSEAVTSTVVDLDAQLLGGGDEPQGAPG